MPRRNHPKKRKTIYRKDNREQETMENDKGIYGFWRDHDSIKNTKKQEKTLHFDRAKNRTQ